MGTFSVESLFSFRKLYLYRFLEAVYYTWVWAGWNMDVLDILLIVLWFFFLIRSIHLKCLNWILPRKPGDPSLNNPPVLLCCPSCFIFLYSTSCYYHSCYMLAACKHEGSDFFKTIVSLQQCLVQNRYSLNTVEWIIIFDFFWKAKSKHSTYLFNIKR